MYYIDEKTVTKAVDQALVTNAIEEMFIRMADGSARNFKIVRENLGVNDAIFGFKSGIDKKTPILGVKAGGLWPGNRQKGIANHQSTIILFDIETGAPLVLVRGTYLTGLRTAAASAISIKHLARQNAETLSLVGAGGQALYQIKAAMMQRNFRAIKIAAASLEEAQSFIESIKISEPSIFSIIQAVSVEQACKEADVLITVTPAFSAYVKHGWIKRGTHIAAMGADTKGKQELNTDLVAACTCYTDEIEQSISLGECQHAVSEKLLEKQAIRIIGDAIVSNAPRKTEDEITLFDSTGVGQQDLAAAHLVFKRCKEMGLLRLIDEAGPA